jgi:predicted regulator of Ras-like GTPase activity (Roadblock/LC7/MglB family)
MTRNDPFSRLLSQEKHGWILDGLLKTYGARHALLITSDGIVPVTSKGLDNDTAESTAAALSGLQALSRSLAGFAGSSDGSWRQTLVQLADAYVFLAAGGRDTFLAVSTSLEVDEAGMSERMALAVAQLGEQLGVDGRRADPA